MKVVLLSALALCCYTASAQTLPVDSLTHKVSYQAVVQAPGSAATLYSRAKAWAATGLGPRMEVALDDPSAGVFIARVGTIIKTRAAVGSFDQTLWQLLHIETKEGRYQYILTDFALQPYVYSPANRTLPSKSQTKLVPVEENLRKNAPKIYAQSILEGVSNTANAQIGGLKKALATTSGW